jgi:hypothetical protein
MIKKIAIRNKKIILHESFLLLLINYCKFSLFRFLTRNSPSIFFEGNDLISISPQVTELHEPAITHLIGV